MAETARNLKLSKSKWVAGTFREHPQSDWPQSVREIVRLSAPYNLLNRLYCRYAIIPKRPGYYVRSDPRFSQR